MEQMRQKIDLGLQPLGDPRQPRKGLVGEDLGRTNFVSRTTKNALKSSQITHSSHSSESDDELDAFSSKNKSRHSPHESWSEASPRAKGMYKLQKRKPSKGFAKSAILSSKDRAQSSPQSLHGSKPSWNISGHKAPRSYLEELNSNRTSLLTTSGAEKTQSNLSFIKDTAKTKKAASQRHARKIAPFPVNLSPSKDSPTNREPAPFPVELPVIQRQSLVPKPFPIELPVIQRQSLVPKPFPVELPVIQRQSLVPKPFPLDDPAAFSCTNNIDNDELDVVEEFTSKPAIYDGVERRISTQTRSPGPDNFGDLSLSEYVTQYTVDPSTLCPYCDEPWPSTPSPTLVALLERTKCKSYADPRHGNPLGLKAPLAVFVDLCQRHRLEVMHLPLARAKGWPTEIDFARLPARIAAFKKSLRKLIKRPNKSKFWKEMQDEAREIGLLKIRSVIGQYATFERAQPGYYGEQGSIIIHQCLYSLFPPESIQTETIVPVTADQFFTRVLVPETALLLIQEDMGLSTKEEAMKILDESKEYGVAMFPEQMQNDDVAEIGEQLARDRARARRKFLEERGEADEDVRRQVEREKRHAEKAKTNGREISTDRPKWKGEVEGSEFGYSTQNKAKKTKGIKLGDVDTTSANHGSGKSEETQTLHQAPAFRPAKRDKSARKSPTEANPLASTSEFPGEHLSSDDEDVRKKPKTTASQHQISRYGCLEDDDQVKDPEVPKPRTKARKVTKSIKDLGDEEGVSEALSHTPLYESKGRSKHKEQEDNAGESTDVAKRSKTLGWTKRRKIGKPNSIPNHDAMIID